MTTDPRSLPLLRCREDGTWERLAFGSLLRGEPVYEPVEWDEAAYEAKQRRALDRREQRSKGMTDEQIQLQHAYNLLFETHHRETAQLRAELAAAEQRAEESNRAWQAAERELDKLKRQKAKGKKD